VQRRSRAVDHPEELRDLRGKLRRRFRSAHSVVQSVSSVAGMRKSASGNISIRAMSA
jgi:hypothetical protein